MFKTRTMVLSAVFVSCFSGVALAAVSTEEAAQLGKTLTPWGAEIAGNKEGSIPAYTGEVPKPPTTFKAGNGYWPDPYADEKPLFRIDSKNMSKYADKLSEGTKMLLQRYPDSYYLNVYPTHRPAMYPEWVQKNSIRNATGCKTSQEGMAVEKACRGGVPFPIPKTGNEVMWNALLAYNGDGSFHVKANRSWMVDAAGKPLLASEYRAWEERPFWQGNQPGREDTDIAVRSANVTLAPTRRAGEAFTLQDYLDPIKTERKALTYTPGQRRIKGAPELSYDTPSAQTGGLSYYDEIYLFYGRMDRFDFKLIGKKEMYLPSNSYKVTQACGAPDQLLMAHHVNPECERWELHRTYQVNATLKPGMRHSQPKKTWYWDEDSLAVGLYDAWDQAGNLFRGGHSFGFVLYDQGFSYVPSTALYDFNKRGYTYNNESVSGNRGGYSYSTKPVSDRDVNFESFVGSILQ
ncbi:MAG TPA: DUF1329 domain-containing protein [Pseudomonas sp.]|nr:DUF1329 domain-containing protein [Pseudomonas sp.]